MVCRNCKKIIPDGSELCPECGSKVRKDSGFAPSGPAPRAKHKSSNVKVLIIVLCMAMILAAALIVFITMKNNVSEQQVIERIGSLIEAGDYESAIEEYNEAVKHGLHDDELDKKMKDVYIKWVYGKIKSMYKDMQGSFSFDQFPMEEMMKKIKELQEMYFGGSGLPDEFDDLYDEMLEYMKNYGSGDPGGSEAPSIPIPDDILKMIEKMKDQQQIL